MPNPHNQTRSPIPTHPSRSFPLESSLSQVLPVYLDELNELNELDELDEAGRGGSGSCHSARSGRSRSSGRSLRSSRSARSDETPCRGTEDTGIPILKNAAPPGTSRHQGLGFTEPYSTNRNSYGRESRTGHPARVKKHADECEGEGEVGRPEGAVLPSPSFPLILISPQSGRFENRIESHGDTSSRTQEDRDGADKAERLVSLNGLEDRAYDPAPTTLSRHPSYFSYSQHPSYTSYSTYVNDVNDVPQTTPTPTPTPTRTMGNPSHSPQTIYSETTETGTEDYFKLGSLADLDPGAGAGGLGCPLGQKGGGSPASGSGLGFGGDKPRRKGLGRGESSTRTGLGRVLPVSKWTRLFLLLVLLETVVDLGIQFYLWRRFTHVIDSDQATALIRENQRRFPVYLAVFAMAHLWQLILAIDGAYYRNTIQIIGLSIFNALFLAWAALQITEIKAMFASTIIIIDSTIRNSLYNDLPVTALTGSMLGIIAFVEVGFILLSWRVYKEMGWQIYHDLGADLRIKAYHFHYQIFVCILRFAAFFFAGFGIQFIWLVLYQAEDAEYYATIVLLPVSMLVLLWGAYAAHRENHVLMSGFMVALLGAGGYFTYKTVRVYQAKETFELVYKSITIFSALSIVITVLALVWSGIVMFNFGKGLKRQRERMSQKRKDKRAQRKMAAKADPSTPGVDSEIEMKRHRMSID